MTAIPVTVKLDGRLFWKLGDIAERRKTTVAQILADLADDMVTAKPKPVLRYPRFGPRDLERLIVLYHRGHIDSEIAELMGFNVKTISDHRNRAGLHRKKGRRTILELERMKPITKETK